MYTYIYIYTYIYTIYIHAFTHTIYYMTIWYVCIAFFLHHTSVAPRGHPACVTRFLSSWARIAAWKIRHGLVQTAVNSVLKKKNMKWPWKNRDYDAFALRFRHPKRLWYPWVPLGYPRQLSDSHGMSSVVPRCCERAKRLTGWLPIVAWSCHQSNWGWCQHSS